MQFLIGSSLFAIGLGRRIYIWFWFCQFRVGMVRCVRELGFQQPALCRKQLTWRCAATTEGKQIGGKNQMLVIFLMIELVYSIFGVKANRSRFLSLGTRSLGAI